MVRLILVGILAFLLESTTALAPVIKPNKLNPGDTVAFISPASTVHAAFSNIEVYKTHVTQGMAALGLKPLFSPNAFLNGPSGLAGDDSQRASDLMWAFTNPNVTGIIANRGGWGCNRIIDMLDYDVIRENPKIFMGYSDVTGCTLAFNRQTDLVTFSGPVGTDTFGPNWNSIYLKRVLMDGESNLLYTNPPSGPNITTIVPGKARGRLIGGTLTVLGAMMGSKYTPSLDEPYILFLEDTSDNTYRLDRLMTQLHLAGYFENAQGLIWGTCVNCVPDKPEHWEVEDLIQQRWGHLSNIPSFSGAMIGHYGQQFTLPIGSQVEMDADEGTILLLEAAVNA